MSLQFIEGTKLVDSLVVRLRNPPQNVQVLDSQTRADSMRSEF